MAYTEYQAWACRFVTRNGNHYAVEGRCWKRFFYEPKQKYLVVIVLMYTRDVGYAAPHTPPVTHHCKYLPSAKPQRRSPNVFLHYLILLNHYRCPFPGKGGHFFDRIFSFGKCNCQKLSISPRL